MNVKLSPNFKHYKNGNYDVWISPIDGTKIRDNNRDDNLFIAEFPECADVCITKMCDVGCPFCYVNSNADGKHASFSDMKPVFDTFRPWTEVAIGGGSPILHPELCDILQFLLEKNVIANITVHKNHIKKVIPYLGGINPLLKGVGISTPDFDEKVNDIINFNEDLRNRGVLHLIIGIVEPSDIEKWIAAGRKILLLGYKNMGRGKIDGELLKETEDRIEKTHDLIKRVINNEENKNTISFDNMALKQLRIRDIIGEDTWNHTYMGDDGVDGDMTSASMYIDLVDWTFSRNSVNSVVHPIESVDVADMYKVLKTN